MSDSNTNPAFSKSNIKMSTSGNIGCYAVSTVDFNSWMSEPVLSSTSKNRRHKGTRELIHKNFDTYASITSDPFWKNKFVEASLDKFPPKFSYRDNTLYFRKGYKHDKLELPLNPYDAQAKCIEFLRAHGGFCSPLEEQKALEEREVIVTPAVFEQKQLLWSDLTKREQECVLSQYVLDQQKELQLNPLQADQLLELLTVALMYKQLVPTNITLEGTQIIKIDKLARNDQKFYLEGVNTSVPTEFDDFLINTLVPNVELTMAKLGTTRSKQKVKDTQPDFMAKWGKYMEQIDTKCEVRQKRRDKLILVDNSENEQIDDQGETDTELTDMSDVYNTSPMTSVTSDDW
jgi:hypothetical protein